MRRGGEGGYRTGRDRKGREGIERDGKGLKETGHKGIRRNREDWEGMERDGRGGKLVTIILYSNAQMHGQRYANVLR